MSRRRHMLFYITRGQSSVVWWTWDVWADKMSQSLPGSFCVVNTIQRTVNALSLEWWTSTWMSRIRFLARTFGFSLHDSGAHPDPGTEREADPYYTASVHCVEHCHGSSVCTISKGATARTARVRFPAREAYCSLLHSVQPIQPPVQWLPGTLPGSEAAEAWTWPLTSM
jgi:hypothetical protein